MTLRDWFAGQAMMGMLAFSGGPTAATHDGMNKRLADCAYQAADAMLAERSK